MIFIEFELTGRHKIDTTVRVIDTEQSQPLAERTFPNTIFLDAQRTTDNVVRIDLGREGS